MLEVQLFEVWDLELSMLRTWPLVGQNFLSFFFFFYLPGEVCASPAFVISMYDKALDRFATGYCSSRLIATTLMEL